MSKPLLIFALICCAVVAIILAMGMQQFGKGGVEGAKRSNKLMQYRILAQFVAVIAILLFVTLGRG